MKSNRPLEVEPSPQQQWLLRAALWQGPAARAAWEKWRARIDIENLDESSTSLLPLLLANLEKQGIEDPLTARFKSVQRSIWYRNRMLLGRVALLLHAFENAGVKTMLLGEAAVLMMYYQDSGLRPVRECELMVRVDQCELAWEVLRQQGWHSKFGACRAANLDLWRRFHSLRFMDDKGQQIRIHCSAEGGNEVADQLWQGAFPLCLQDANTLTPHAAHQLWWLCANSLQWNVVLPLGKLADAMLILQAAQMDDPCFKLDWSCLEKNAIQSGLAPPFYHWFTFLQEKLNAPIPPGTLAVWGKVKPSRAERVAFAARQRRANLSGMFLLLWLHYHVFLQQERKPKRLTAWLQFPRYLQHLWEVEKISHLPLAAFGKMRRCWRQKYFQGKVG